MEWVSKYFGSNVLKSGDIILKWVLDHPKATFTETLNGEQVVSPVDLTFGDN